MSEYLTPDDVAEITGFSVYTIRAAVRDCELRASKRRGRILIHRDWLADWMDAGTIRPGETVDRTAGVSRTPAPPRPTLDSRTNAQRARDLLRRRSEAA